GHDLGSPLVAVDRLAMVAEVAVRVAEAVPGPGLALAVVQLLGHQEGVVAVAHGQLVPADQGVRPAERVERPRLAGPVAGRAVEPQRPFSVWHALRRILQALPDPGQAQVGPGGGEAVAGPLAQAQRPFVLPAGLVEQAELAVSGADGPVGVGLGL